MDLHRAVSTEFSTRNGQPGVIQSQYGVTNAIARPQTTIFGKEAYPTFADKAAALFFAILQNSPFHADNRRLALAALFAFCDINGMAMDEKTVDDKALENLVKKAAGPRDHGVPAESAFGEVRLLLSRIVVKR